MCHVHVRRQSAGRSDIARAGYLKRRDGRYWVQFRFDPFRISPDPIRHIRFALRTELARGICTGRSDPWPAKFGDRDAGREDQAV